MMQPTKSKEVQKYHKIDIKFGSILVHCGAGVSRVNFY